MYICMTYQHVNVFNSIFLFFLHSAHCMSSIRDRGRRREEEGGKGEEGEGEDQRQPKGDELH